MKKLIFLFFVIITLSSCRVEPSSYEYNESLSLTTINVLNNIDTLNQYSIVDNRIYVLRDSLVIHEAYVYTNTDIVDIPAGILITLVLVMFLFGLFLGMAIS